MEKNAAETSAVELLVALAQAEAMLNANDNAETLSRFEAARDAVYAAAQALAANRDYSLLEEQDAFTRRYRLALFFRGAFCSWVTLSSGLTAEQRAEVLAESRQALRTYAAKHEDNHYGVEEDLRDYVLRVEGAVMGHCASDYSKDVGGQDRLA